MIYITSDLHLNHFNIIKYTNRPFKTLNEMNDTIINNWNSKISNNDTVYILGDFCFKNTNDFVNKLNGKDLFLLRGDHDSSSQSYNKLKIVDRILTLEINKYPIVLSHWAFRVWWKSHYNSIMLYGHSHGKLEPIGKSHDVGVDNNNFYPWSIDEIFELMKNKPNNINYLGDNYEKN